DVTYNQMFKKWQEV
ncbi:TPA: hypothetical protein PR431_002457, partial [Staphylococcus aureus]|nr:hypothetical protein [Staphylococcus aureus]